MNYEDDDTLGSIYDPPEKSDEELWFVPPLDDGEDDADLFDVPGPKADRRLLVDPEEWREAEREHAVELAHAAGEMARLDAMLDTLDANFVPRLALAAAEGMTWAEGSRVRAEEIARDLAESTTDPMIHFDLTRARWSYRRLLARPAPLGNLREFLGLRDAGSLWSLPEEYPRRVYGDDFKGAEEDFEALMGAMGASHPLTRGAFGYAVWQIAGLSAPGAVGEAATAAMRLAGTENKKIAFSPCSAARDVWCRGGSASERLLRWLTSVRHGSQAAIMEIRLLRDWGARAKEALAKEARGKTPDRMITAFWECPLLGADDAARIAGVSRDSAERQIARMERLELVREVTGFSRFRLWTAKAGRR